MNLTSIRDRQLFWIVLLLAAVGLFIGWRRFWFLTDDAFIAFRYVSNSILGHGYTWNAAPFRPVEGYTSFLWVILLEAVWRLFGVMPPQSANTLSLGFSFLSMVIASVVVMRMNLRTQLVRYRPALVALLLIGMLLNTTFLTWSSSGLETALFNCCFLAWVVLAVSAKERGSLWRTGLMATAVLVYLARPDGLLILISTIIMIVISLLWEKRSGKIGPKSFLPLLPLVIPVIHLIWRRLYYGEWLPNTYYAKHLAAWPEAGMKYLTSFIIEYGLWTWLIVLLAVIVVAIIRLKTDTRASDKDEGDKGSTWLNDITERRLGVVIVVVTILAHVGYYTFIIGGDHFEWRVYSHLIPLIFLTLIYFVSFLNLRTRWSLALIVLVIIISIPIQWVQHLLTGRVEALERGEDIKVHVADKMPPGFRWLAGPHDALQDWLIDHAICVRRKQHRMFWRFQKGRWPDRTLDVPEQAGEFPVGYFTFAGMPGWVLPNVNIIDGYGLSDYVIARNPPQPGQQRLMAHGRFPPPGYVESFLPNVIFVGPKDVQYEQRPPDSELTAERIIQLEKFWADRLVQGLNLLRPVLPPN